MKVICIILFMSQYCTSYSNNDCMTDVESCPVTKREWSNRGQAYNCTERHYVCIMNKDGHLVEACITEYTIMDGVGGCPFIRACSGREPFLAENSKFKTCMHNNTDCPPINHGGYTVLELYKYPACIGFTEKNGITDNDVIDDAFAQGSIIAIAVSLGLVIVLCIIFITVFVRRRKRQKQKEKKTAENDKFDPLLEKQKKDLKDKGGDKLLENKKTLGDIQKENTSEIRNPSDEIVKTAIPLMQSNGILILISDSKTAMASAAEKLATTFDVKKSAPGFRDFVQSYKSTRNNTDQTTCVLFIDCFQNDESGELLRLHDLRETFDHLFEILLECEGRMKYIITMTKTLWNGRKKFFTSNRLFNEHYVLEF